MKHHAIVHFVLAIIALSVCYSIVLTVFIRKSRQRLERESAEMTANGKPDCFNNCDCRKKKA